MDALIYDDTPLATYFEGEAVSDNLPQEKTPPRTPFAPRGLPNFKGRLRKIRRSASSIAPGSAYTEELLEKFRYVIVASQLLSDERGPRLSLTDHESSRSDLVTLRGAIASAVASFLAAWAINWLSTRRGTANTLTWADVGTYSVGIVLVAVAATYIGRRQYTNYLQRASVRTLAKYVNESHSLDTAATNVMRFIQEVEVVARGYDLGSPLPPVSRLEEQKVVRRCQTLRRELSTALKLLTILMVESHDSVQPYLNTIDLQRYHDIYEVSIVEYSQAIELVHHQAEAAQDSLKELRFATGLHALARKVLLCDLLALQQARGWSRFQQWNHALRVLREIEVETTARHSRLSNVLAEQEWGHVGARRKSYDASSQSDGESIQDSPTIRMQLRRFDDLAHSIRTLNAKMHLIREEVNGLAGANSEDGVVASALLKHYDSVGTELRSVLSEWDLGRSAMLHSHEIDHDQASRASSTIRTPISPSPSLGGLQIVDGGPSDALQLLSGDSPSSAYTKGIFDEEVFEAVASRVPRKRMSVSAMTREEKIARMAEERRKRATLHEQSDNTTNMLRELQMVIKHRPKGSLAVNASINTNTNGYRVTSL